MAAHSNVTLANFASHALRTLLIMLVTLLAESPLRMREGPRQELCGLKSWNGLKQNSLVCFVIHPERLLLYLEAEALASAADQLL
jgi:hypothetical protein